MTKTPPPLPPDAPASLSAPSEAAASFPCAKCGADLRFQPGAAALVCAYCNHTNPVAPDDGADIAELDFRKALRNEIAVAEIETTQTAHCESCGADVSFDPDVHAAECPFCAGPIVAETRPDRHFKPKGVLPFAIDAKQAQDALGAWLKERWFAPNALARYARAEGRMAGIYIPYWTFDADTETDYDGQRGDAYYVSRTVGSGENRRTERVQKIRWTRVSGHTARAFDDVLVAASRSLPVDRLEHIDHWDLYALVPYAPDYLAGFRARSYTVDLEEGFEDAKAKMALRIRRDVAFDIGGDRQRVDALRTRHDNVTFKHILLPVWVAAYRYRGKAYRVLINGRTGRAAGDRPYSPWKIAFAGALAVAAIGGALWLWALYGAR